MVFLKNTLKYQQAQTLINALRKTSPQTLAAESEKKALQSYARAAQSPLYQKLIAGKAPVAKNLADFKEKVPVLDKKHIFAEEHIAHILHQIPSESSASLLLSSGTSGMFSFGISTQKDLGFSSRLLDIMLQHYFNILKKNTLIINTLSQAVKLYNISATTVDTGPRHDSVYYILKNVSPSYDQTIVIGDNHFVKNALEYAFENHIELKALHLSCILGGIYLTENLRGHLSRLIGAEKNELRIFSSMGISEFGLNLFFESPETVRLRQFTANNTGFLEKLLGNSHALYPGYLPMFFNYFPQFYYLEEVQQCLTVTDLKNKPLLPLIRYNTGDVGKIIPYDTVKEVSNTPEFLPPFRSPLVLVYGKADGVEWEGKTIYPQQIQEGLYSDPEITLAITGAFYLCKKTHLHIDIQLKPDLIPTEKLKSAFSQTLLRFLPVDFTLTLHPYRQYQHQMEIDYERKFRFLN